MNKFMHLGRCEFFGLKIDHKFWIRFRIRILAPKVFLPSWSFRSLWRGKKSFNSFSTFFRIKFGQKCFRLSISSSHKKLFSNFFTSFVHPVEVLLESGLDGRWRVAIKSLFFGQCCVNLRICVVWIASDTCVASGLIASSVAIRGSNHPFSFSKFSKRQFRHFAEAAKTICRRKINLWLNKF